MTVLQKVLKTVENMVLWVTIPAAALPFMSLSQEPGTTVISLQLCSLQ